MPGKRDVARQRLANQFLTRPTAGDPAALVRRLGAVQAQEYLVAKWGMSLRLKGASHDAIEKAIDDGRILRTHILRPTWHFVTAEDIRWMLDLTAPRIRASMRASDRHLDMNADVLRRSMRAIEKALAKAGELTRQELVPHLAAAGVGSTAAQRLGHIMMRAELDAVVCSGRRRGRQFTYALLDQRAPARSPRDRDESLAELARRYFRTRGPASPHDFSWWSGLTMPDARRAVEILARELRRVEIDGRVLYTAGTRTVRPGSSLFALPIYDEFYIAYRDRDAIMQRLRKAGVDERGGFPFANVIVSDGQMVGTWTKFARDPAPTPQLFVPLRERERRKLVAQMRQLSEFIG